MLEEDRVGVCETDGDVEREEEVEAKTVGECEAESWEWVLESERVDVRVPDVDTEGENDGVTDAEKVERGDWEED